MPMLKYDIQANCAYLKKDLYHKGNYKAGDES